MRIDGGVRIVLHPEKKTKLIQPVPKVEKQKNSNEKKEHQHEWHA